MRRGLEDLVTVHDGIVLKIHLTAQVLHHLAVVGEGLKTIDVRVADRMRAGGGGQLVGRGLQQRRRPGDGRQPHRHAADFETDDERTAEAH